MSMNRKARWWLACCGFWLAVSLSTWKIMLWPPNCCRNFPVGRTGRLNKVSGRLWYKDLSHGPSLSFPHLAWLKPLPFLESMLVSGHLQARSSIKGFTWNNWLKATRLLETWFWSRLKTVDDFHEIHDQWTAGASFHPVSTLIEGRQEVDNGRQVQISVKRGRFQMKLEEFTLVSLGVAAPQPRPPKAANLSKFQPEKKVSVRIAAPAHYRESFLESGQGDNAKSVLLEIAQWKVAQASAISGGAWQWQTVQKCHNLVGHVPQIAKGPEAHSGTRGIFVTLTGVAKRAEKVKWLKKRDDQDPDNYFRERGAFAKERGQSLKFRMGGGSDLGVMFLPTDKTENSHIQVEIHGTPKVWEADEVLDFWVNKGGTTWPHCLVEWNADSLFGPFVLFLLWTLPRICLLALLGIMWILVIGTCKFMSLERLVNFPGRKPCFRPRRPGKPSEIGLLRFQLPKLLTHRWSRTLKKKMQKRLRPLLRTIRRTGHEAEVLKEKVGKKGVLYHHCLSFRHRSMMSSRTWKIWDTKMWMLGETVIVVIVLLLWLPVSTLTQKKFWQMSKPVWRVPNWEVWQLQTAEKRPGNMSPFLPKIKTFPPKTPRLIAKLSLTIG